MIPADAQVKGGGQKRWKRGGLVKWMQWDQKTSVSTFSLLILFALDEMN